MALLTNHVSAVIGGTSGIGARTAELFAAQGATVVVAGRRHEQGEELAARLGPRAVFVRADVTRESDVAAVIAHAVERHGRLDSLVNCAGVTGFVGGVAEVDLAEFTAMMAVHAAGRGRAASSTWPASAAVSPAGPATPTPRPRPPSSS